MTAHDAIKDKKIVVIGGGTGNYTVLSALRTTGAHLTAIVAMSDDGGSTGVLRDELGVLPPGDVRQCLVALSNSPKLRDLFQYRFEEGTFGGHSVGNILLTALEKISDNFVDAIETASEVLNVRGKVVPATLDNVRLKMAWPDKRAILHGEHVIDAENFEHDPRNAILSLEPDPVVNPDAIQAINNADLVVIAPGGLYTSLAPTLVIEGVGRALQSTPAKVLYVCNLVTVEGQTNNFSVADHISEIERFAKNQCIDAVLFNTAQPEAALLSLYNEEHAELVENKGDMNPKVKLIPADLLGRPAAASKVEASAVTRSLIRHDLQALKMAIITYLSEKGQVDG